MEKRCPHCGYMISADLKICPMCGTAISPCPQCGNLVEEPLPFQCPWCKTELRTNPGVSNAGQTIRPPRGSMDMAPSMDDLDVSLNQTVRPHSRSYTFGVSPAVDSSGVSPAVDPSGGSSVPQQNVMPDTLPPTGVFRRYEGSTGSAICNAIEFGFLGYMVGNYFSGPLAGMFMAILFACMGAVFGYYSRIICF